MRKRPAGPWSRHRLEPLAPWVGGVLSIGLGADSLIRGIDLIRSGPITGAAGAVIDMYGTDTYGCTLIACATLLLVGILIRRVWIMLAGHALLACVYCWLGLARAVMLPEVNWLGMRFVADSAFFAAISFALAAALARQVRRSPLERS